MTDDPIRVLMVEDQTDLREMIGLALRDLLAALDGLGEDHKALLLLVGVEDLSYAEAAAVLGVPLGTVMSRLSRARARLRSALGTVRVLPLRSIK